MPGLDGWETVRQIRATQDGRHLPAILMITAHGRELLAERLNGRDNPLDGLLAKPVTPLMLFDAVADATHGGSVQAERRARHRVPPAPGEQPLRGLRLLPVEDNPLNQQVAQELLGQAGTRVEIANDGRQGIACVRRAEPPFDAVLRHCRDMEGNPPAVDTGKPAETLPQPPSGFELAAALARLGGNRALFADLVQRFSGDREDIMTRAETALRQGDRPAARRELHTLKGLAATLGATALAARAATTAAPQRSRALLGELAGLLAEHNLRALDVHATLRAGNADLPAVPLAALDTALASLDFATARVEVAHLAALLP